MKKKKAAPHSRFNTERKISIFWKRIFRIPFWKQRILWFVFLVERSL